MIARGDFDSVYAMQQAWVNALGGAAEGLFHASALQAEVGTEVVMAVLGGLSGAADDAFRWADDVAPKVTGKAYHYTDDATAALIEKSQLGLPGRTTFLTPNGRLSPLQAQIELALPQRNTARALFEVTVDNLDPSKVIRKGRVTGNVFNRGGGGMELLYDGPIPLEHIRRIR